jgi:hypothetical protein
MPAPRPASSAGRVRPPAKWISFTPPPSSFLRPVRVSRGVIGSATLVYAGRDRLAIVAIGSRDGVCGAGAFVCGLLSPVSLSSRCATWPSMVYPYAIVEIPAVTAAALLGKPNRSPARLRSASPSRDSLLGAATALEESDRNPARPSGASFDARAARARQSGLGGLAVSVRRRGTSTTRAAIAPSSTHIGQDQKEGD